MTLGLSRRLAEFLAATRYPDLPASVTEHARRAVLDWLGSALGGAIELPARMAQQFVTSLGVSNQATVFSGGRSSASGAALANGVASHILEFDDIHKTSTVHAAAPVISAALAVAEREHVDGRAFLLAVTLGYEAALRIGEAVNPSHYRYWHPTGTAATFGAAAGAGSLMQLSPAQMLDALGSAGTQAAGLWEFNADGAMSKHLHPGKAAFNGVLSADLARIGFTGATRILEGQRGFFRAMSDAYDESRITDGLGERWKIAENCYKLHSCCGHTHTAIDVALDLAAQVQSVNPSAEAHTSDLLWGGPPGPRPAPWPGFTSRRENARQGAGDRPGGLSHILIETYGPGYEIVKELAPRTPYQAKFSIAYCVAVALLDGCVGLDQFSPERLRDPAIAALLERTQVVVADDLTARYPAAWPTRVTLTLTNGATLTASSDYPRGNPENPVSTAQLEDKFRSLVTPRFSAGTAERGIEAVQSLETCEDVSTVFRDLVHERHQPPR
ncbi:MAG: MmgE/PrpD family protein [Bryobacteraceae bacterium]